MMSTMTGRLSLMEVTNCRCYVGPLATYHIPDSGLPGTTLGIN